MKFFVDDRVIGRKNEVHFDNFQDAWCALYARLVGAPKSIEWTTNYDGDDLIIIHKYLKKSEL